MFDQESTYIRPTKELTLSYGNHVETPRFSEDKRFSVKRAVRDASFDGEKGWIYIKLYTPYGLQNLLLVQNVLRFIKENSINQWFFIRYEDPKPHVRFRFRGDGCNAVEFKCIFSWLKKLLLSGMIFDYSFSSYQREIERYGGVSTYGLVENVFEVDSKLIINLLSRTADYSSEEVDAVVTMLGVQLLEALNVENAKLLKMFFLRDEMKSSVSRNKFSVFKQLTRTDTNKINEIFKEMAVDQENFAKSINDFISAVVVNGCNVQMDSVLNSIFHMHFNRVFGDRKHEQLIRTMMFRLMKERMHRIE